MNLGREKLSNKENTIEIQVKHNFNTRNTQLSNKDLTSKIHVKHNFNTRNTQLSNKDPTSKRHVKHNFKTRNTQFKYNYLDQFAQNTGISQGPYNLNTTKC